MAIFNPERSFVNVPSQPPQVPADLVANLPGFGAPLSPLYSGYLSAGAGKHHHYVFSQSLSATAATDDLVIWFNGAF